MLFKKYRLMKKILLFSFGILTFVSCNDKKEVVESEVIEQEKFTVFGDSISNNEVVTKEEMLAKYESMKPTDTLNIKFGADIISTCAKKGCWMKLNLSDGKESFVSFKDYAFFVPKEGAENHYAIVEGKAFIEEVSIDELKHYAKDEGKSQQAIDSIVEPKRTLRFIANGVLIADGE